MTEAPNPGDSGDRGGGNLILLIGFAAIVGLGLWLVMLLDQHRKIDDCVSQGQRNCIPVDIAPAR